MCDLIGISELLNSRCGIAAADDGNSGGCGYGLCDQTCSFGESVKFKYAHGSVPYNRLGRCDGLGEKSDRLGSDIKAHPAVRHLRGINCLCVGIGGESVGYDVVNGEKKLNALGGCFFEEALGKVKLVGFAERRSDGIALCCEERVCHTAADDDRVGLFDQVVDNADLVGNLGAAQDRDEGTCRLGESLAHNVKLLGNQVTGCGRKEIRKAGRGSVCAVSRSESIVDIEIRKRSKLSRKSGIVLRLFLVKTDILKHQDLAVLKSGSLRLGIVADHVGSKYNRLSDQFGQTVGGRLHGENSLRSVLRASEMGNENNFGVVLYEVGNCGKSASDTLVVCDCSCLLVLRNVKIHADDNSFTGDLQIFNSFLGDHCHIIHTPCIL